MKQEHRNPILIGRRSFMKIGGIGLGALVNGGVLLNSVARAAAGTARRLVVLECNGGNDGLNTFVPYGSGAYYDLRKGLAIRESEVLRIDSAWGFHPVLSKLKRRYDAGQVAVFRGIGFPAAPDLSHFAMQDVWRSGHPGGAQQTGRTGWLGRLLDVVGDPAAPLAGFSLSTSVSPVLVAQIDQSGAAESPDAGALEIPQPLGQVFRSAFQRMAEIDDRDSGLINAARKGMATSLPISDFLGRIGEIDQPYRDTYTGYSLAFAARILALNDWVRVVHVPLPLDFDTHTDQKAQQRSNLADMDGAIDGFLDDLDTLNLADKTIIVIVSEFGRRAGLNGEADIYPGTDHGTANSLFVIGRMVRGGLYGEPPSLTRLDSDGNLIATNSFQNLLATAAEGWMGAPASEVVPGGSPQNVFR